MTKAAITTKTAITMAGLLVVVLYAETTLAAPVCCRGAKPIDELTMVWAGTGALNVPIRVKAWRGDVGEQLLADIDNIFVGDEVTISGFAGSPKDIIWEIFAAGTSMKLGESTFRLSCSDKDMNGPEDCGKLEGDGKRKKGFINQWVFDGMAGNGTLAVECTPSPECVAAGPGPFDCREAKPIDELTMVWAGTGALNVPIRVKAWRGDVGEPLVADIDNIFVGDEITISGFAGSPNDIIWEIFAAGTSMKLGESTFRLSCSDKDMNGPEDCGKLEGNGKKKKGFINQWVFEGMAGSGQRLDCTP